MLGGTHEALTSNRADLVIGVEASQSSGIKYHKIREVEWVFAVAPDHELTQATLPLSRQQIEQHRFIVVRDSARNQAPQTHRVFSKRPVLSVASMAEKIQAQCLGLGVGFLPAHRIRDLLAQGSLTALSVEETIQTDTLHLAWKANNKGKVLRWFIKQLSQK